MKRKGIRLLLFICLAAALLHAADCMLCVKSLHGVDQMRYLYYQPDHTIDVLFLGSSHVYCNVNTQVLWEEQGMAAYLCASAQQPLWNSYYALKEALKTQSPKLVVLDMYCPSRFYEDYQPEWNDENLAGMRFSFNKYQAVRASAETDRAELLLGFPRYHTRYDRLEAEDFRNFLWNRPEQARWKGYTALVTNVGLTEYDYSYVTGVREMTEKSQEYFDRIEQLTREKGIALALISAPYLPEEQDMEVYHYIERLAEERGLLFLNYNTVERYREIGIDYALDFADFTHLNEQGSVKYTKHLGSWLAEHYEIPDRRGQRGYETWENQLRREGTSNPS